MYVYTATIGRNISTSTSAYEMSAVRWETFIDYVSEQLSVYVFRTDDAIEIHRGTGVWDGVKEDSAKITLLKAQAPLEEKALDDLRRHLSELARMFDQDAIALTIGESELC